MQSLRIDSAVVNTVMTPAARFEVLSTILEAVGAVGPENINWTYFGHLNQYAGRSQPLPARVSAGHDLWPPNIAALDYILKNEPKEVAILDFGCGFGNLLVYLRQAGYTNLYGYDDWSQLPEGAARAFLDRYHLTDKLVRQLPAQVDVVVSVGVHWHWFARDGLAWLGKSGAVHLLIDACYLPLEVPHFMAIGEYEDLLRVYERTDES